MAYNVTLRTKTLFGSINIFDSEKVRWVTGGVTLDAAAVRTDPTTNRRRLRAGEFLGRITATGLYAPVRRAAVVAGGAAAGQAVVGVKPTVLGGASYFQVGDAITVGAEAHTILAIDYGTNTITLAANLAGAHAEDAPVAIADGSAIARVMLGEDVDFELDNSGQFGDQVAAAFDWARVLEARLPRPSDVMVRTELPQITFA